MEWDLIDFQAILEPVPAGNQAGDWDMEDENHLRLYQW